MATYNIYRVRIGSVGDVDYPTGSIVYVKWNDGTNDFQVDVHNSSDVYVSTETSGPDLSVDDYTLVEYNFQFCDSSTLVTFSFNPSVFPYASKILTPNAAQCSLNHVCDIKVTEVTVTNTTNSSSSDGQAVITVTGSGDAPYEYSLTPDFSSVQSSATFTGLAVGNYKVYSRSQLYKNCISSKSFTVGFDADYAVRYRGTFDTNLAVELPGYEYRVDILERDFVGAITNVCMGDVPFVLTYQGETEDKYKSIIATKATIQLISETDLYFADLFTGDERQFQVKFYINDGSGFELEWIGYVLQQGYEEAYIAAPYVVTLIATDGLADLADEEYSDVGDKSLISIISKCISPTDLNINIRSAISIFEANHSTGAGDDPLAQTYYDTYFLYTEKSKLQVLEELLKPFGARLFQSQAKWWIIRIEDSSASSLAYREYTQAGVYVSNSTINLQKDLSSPDLTNRLAWSGDPLLRIRAGYKKVTITHNLGLINNLFYEGRFHADDFNEDTGLFNGIGLDLGSSIGADYGLENTRNGDSDHCLFVDFTNASINTGLTVFTENKSIESDNFKDFFKISFDYFIAPQTPVQYIRFNWRIALSGGVYVEYQQFTNHTDGLNPIYANSFNSWQKYEKEFGPLTTTSMQVTLNLLTNNAYDASSLAGLKLLDTDLLDAGEKRIALDTISGDLYLRHYTLQYTTDTEFSPDIIQPNDYATSNKKWFLDNTYPYFSLINPVAFYLIDDLKVEFFPDGDDPEETEVYEIVINGKNKQPYEIDVIFGDLPDTRNAVHIYKNYFKLSDGTPTSLWSRTTISESKKLLDILALDMAAQNVIGIRLLQGALVGDINYRFYNALIDGFSSVAFIPMGLEIDYKNNLYNAEIIEIKTGANAEPPSDSAGFTTGFTIGFRS